MVLSGILLIGSQVLAQTITSSGNGNWSSAGTWVGGIVPASTDNVVVASGHTIAVDDANAVCNNISFGDATAKLNMSTASSVLSVYGDFTLAATTHTAFSAWPDGAKIRFTGTALVQTLRGWSTSAFSTSFNEIIVDKTSGKVVTDGSNMRFQIGTSLDVVNGTFELANPDDIEGRTYANVASSPTITVRSGATFNMAGGASHIRRASNTGEETSKIGSMTVYGTANLAPGSTNKINLLAINIESGGVVELPNGIGIVSASFNPGTITVKSGGTFKVSTTVNCWYTNATTPTTVTVNAGGEYNQAASTVNLPPVYSNSGAMRFSFGGSQTLPASFATYQDLILSSSGAKTLGVNTTINGTLSFRGSASLALGAFSMIYGASSTLQYGASGQSTPQTTSDVEFPLVGGPANVTIYNGGGVTLHASRTLSGTLTLTNGSLALNGKSLSYGTIVGTGGALSETQSLNAPAAANVGNLGALITSGTDLGSTVVKRGYNAQTGNSNNGILRWYEITPTTNTGLNATLVFPYSEGVELNGIAEADLRLFKSIDNGTTWTLAGGTVDPGANTVTLTGIDGFSRWTLGSISAPLPVELTSFSAKGTRAGIELRWSTATELNNIGFEIQRKSAEMAWSAVAFVKGAGTCNIPKEYSFVDYLAATGEYTYRLKQCDNNGSFKYSAETHVSIAVPKVLSLSENYPNPFNPTTNIEFTFPQQGRASLAVYNTLGQQVALLFSDNVEAGKIYRATFDAASLASGMYFSILEFNGQKMTRKMLLVK